MIAVNYCCGNGKAFADEIGKEFGLEGQKLLEFVEKQQKLEEERRREEEEKEEKEERRRILEEDRRKEEKEKEERRRREDKERETRRQQRGLRKLELEADRAKARLMRWAMFLQSYNFKVEAIKGSENVGADYLSRVEE